MCVGYELKGVVTLMVDGQNYILVQINKKNEQSLVFIITVYWVSDTDDVQ